MVSTINRNIEEKIAHLKEYIGNTPLFPLHNLVANKSVKLYAKLEWQQLGGSVKARAAFEIIKTALKQGLLDETKELVDASSGNTAIAYASIAANLGLKTKLFIPLNASQERKTILKALGADLVFTSPFELTEGAQKAAAKYVEENPTTTFYANQYANEANWKAHYHTTANEIWEATQGSITHFVSGLGTSGTFTGTTKRLRELNAEILATELQPETALHGLEGWKDMETAIVPAFYNQNLADDRIHVPTSLAHKTLKRLAKENGLLVSPSAGANLAGALVVANSLQQGTVVTVFPDNGEKYQEVLTEIFS